MGSKDRGEVIFHQKIPPLKNMNCMSSNKGHTKKKNNNPQSFNAPYKHFNEGIVTYP